MIASAWADGARVLADAPGFADVFLPAGRAPQAGEVFVNSALARAYELVAANGRAAFYEGPIARAIARTVLASGHPVLVDAAFLTRADRQRFEALGRGIGVDFLLVVCEAPVDVLRDRVEARRARGRDASEADADVLAHQLTVFEAPDAEELRHAVVVQTNRSPERVREACLEVARAWRDRRD